MVANGANLHAIELGNMVR